MEHLGMLSPYPTPEDIKHIPKNRVSQPCAETCACADVLLQRWNGAQVAELDLSWNQFSAEIFSCLGETLAKRKMAACLQCPGDPGGWCDSQVEMPKVQAVADHGCALPQVKKLNICNCSGGCIDSLSTPVPLAEVGGLAHRRSCEA